MGAYRLFLWAEPAGDGSQRELFPGSPISISVDRNSSDVPKEGKEGGGSSAKKGGAGPSIVPGDYSVKKDVFESAQRRWGACTVDAFASEATTLMPRFWAASESASGNSLGTAEAVDAFQQPWGAAERVWAHPPIELLDRLVAFLKSPQRKAEVLVVAPEHRNKGWFLELVR